MTHVNVTARVRVLVAEFGTLLNLVLGGGAANESMILMHVKFAQQNKKVREALEIFVCWTGDSLFLLIKRKRRARLGFDPSMCSAPSI